MKSDSRASESLLQVRLNPKTKYFATLIAKRSGLTLSEFVESCVDSCLALSELQIDGQHLSYEALQDRLWAEHPADRFARLAFLYPNEMTIRERTLWQNVIRKSDEFWHVPQGEERNVVTVDTFSFDRLRKRWAEFEEFDRNAIAALAKTVKQQTIEEWSRKAVPQQRALIKEQQKLINKMNVKPARKSRRKE